MTNDEILSTLTVDVLHPEGRAEKVVADGPRILVGSGAHCDVCLPLGAAAPEHIEVGVNAQGELFVRALAEQPRATLRGAPFRHERLLPGERLAIGPLQLEVRLSDEASAKRGARSAKPSPRMVIALVAALALAVLSSRPRQGADESKGAQPPALWPGAPATCPHAEPPTALASAADLRAHADAKRERLRFAVHDGIVAVELLETAAACFRVGGHAEAAEEAREIAARLRARIDEDYRGHQLRLEHALAVDEPDTALREVHILRAMIPSATGPYTTWLDSVARTLQQRQQKKGST